MLSKTFLCICASFLLTLPALAQEEGELAIDFSGIELTRGDTITLSDYRGRVVFVDFWASWCLPCLLSLPAYEKIRNELGTEQFEIIAINVDENTEDGLEFLEDNPVSYPVIADPEGEIGIPYKVRSLPVSYLIDQQGEVVASYRSFSPGDEVELKRQIQSLFLP